MKQCLYCQKYFPELDFGIAKTTENKVFRRRKCRYCYRKMKNDLKARNRKWLDEYKRNQKCQKCGIDDPRVLDFHHHTGEKEFGIAEFYYHQFSLEKAKKEIEKCIVICANCHRVLHFESKRTAKDGA